MITKSFKMRYESSKNRVTSHFFGARGLFTFDIRRGKCLDYYDYHYYPITDFDMGREQFSNLAVILHFLIF